MKNRLSQLLAKLRERSADKSHIKTEKKTSDNSFLLSFNFREIVANLFSSAARKPIHTVFIVCLTMSSAILVAKLGVVFLKDTRVHIAQNSAPVMYQPPLERDAVAAIKNANIFNAKLNDADTVESMVSNISTHVCTTASKATGLPITLLSSTVMHDPSKSLVSVQVNNARDLAMLRVGDKILSLAKIDKIERQKLIIKNLRSGECEFVVNKDTQKDIDTKISYNILPAGSKPVHQENANFKQDGNNFKIKKSYRDEMLKDIGTILTQARAIQIKNPDGSLSFKMTEVVPGSIYSHFNIANGDIITSINGEPIRDLNVLMSMFGNIKNINNLQLGVIKDGQEQNMEFSFE